MEKLGAAIIFYRERAQVLYSLASKERDKGRQRVLYAISEYYYLLHDQLIELEKLTPPSSEQVSAKLGYVVPVGRTVSDFLAIPWDPFYDLHFNDNQQPFELTYVVASDGSVTACEEEIWEKFSIDNDGAQLANGSGSNIFSACSDATTASVYRIIHALLQSRKLDQYSFSYRCDSPAQARLFRMTIARYQETSGGAILYRSELLSERPRKPVVLLRREARIHATGPAIKICSFCQSAWDASSGCWVAVELHPAAQDAEAKATHGVCVECNEHIVSPLLKALEICGLDTSAFNISVDSSSQADQIISS